MPRRLSARGVIAGLKGFGFDVVAIRGSHAKLRRVTQAGERQVLTIPLHKDLDVGTIQAIYRQASRFIPERELRLLFHGDRAR
jgi:predicted RNA binding protein YcfA (HicA-like mRNA interferase family)